MIAKTLSTFSLKETTFKLTDALKDGFKPTLAFVFLSIEQDRKAVSALLSKNNIQIFGVTTNGEFIDETIEKGSISILLTDIHPDYFEIHFEAFTDKNYKEVAVGVARKAKSKFQNPAFLTGLSHPATDGEEILRGIEGIVGKDVNAFGCAAGDDFSFTDTYVFTNTIESKEAMLALILDENKIEIQGVASCGWKAVGTEKTVTKSEGNHVYTINNECAVDITARYGGIQNVTPDNKDLLLEIAANFPLQLQREKGDPVMRPPLIVDWSDRSYYTSGTVPEGSKVKFSIPPDFDVMEKVIKDLENLKSTKMPEADALIVFSCAGRLMALGPLMTEEVEGVKKVYNVPMVGMFSNAELARATGGNLEMHNLTTCMVALKEK
ncbi:FIST C-terminal domain-containing protein [Winogradskyella sp. DF17]|uniref:FIST C-terminal domain-containing protein n=1 Tax=Winogradskyella pelagia TaxID=2819984 RepID=A0ABS3T361_9FLAO|nr:FIST N-terminal domain-containing protein [Winogradskyella sp. DF17]MBO3117177.1 FIST C-terminal domain-containing protein [Winogradskyella sp. DF17]